MANPIYARSDLSTAVNGIVHGQVGNLVNEQALYNRAVRSLMGQVDIRSSKRKMAIAPGIYQQIYTYAAPADLKDIAVCDIQRQVHRSEQFFLTTPEEFDRNKIRDTGLVAFDDRDFLRFLLLSTEVQTKEVIINDCESVTANGAWATSNDATNIGVDNSDFINGAASITFDLNNGGTSATLTNSTQTAVNLTSYKNHELFVWVEIPLVTLLTSFTLKWGSDASNYWSQTVTTTHEGLAFYVGWNLLRFNWPATSTGSPVVSSITYLQFNITKDSMMAASNNWHLDFINAQIGDIHSILYYSKYWWQTSGYAYIENSTATTDFLVADTDEFDLIVQYCGKLAAQELRLKDLKDISDEFDRMLKNYKIRYSSDRLLPQTTIHRLASIDGDLDLPVERVNTINGTIDVDDD